MGYAKTGPLVLRLAVWLGQDVDVADNAVNVVSCQCWTYQRTKTEHGGPRGGLLRPLQLQSRPGPPGGLIGAGCTARLGLTTAAAG